MKDKAFKRTFCDLNVNDDVHFALRKRQKRTRRCKKEMVIKMRTSRKLMLISALLALIALLTVLPTLSWLSATSKPVINTFAGGAIAIRLDEALVGADGKAVVGEGAKRVTANHYKCAPGAVLDKDPTPAVLKGSEECYVFLLIENELGDGFAMNFDTASWKQVAESDGKAVYVYHVRIDALNASEDVTLHPIFTEVAVSSELTVEEIEALGEKQLRVTAFAVQTANIDTRTAAELAVNQFGLSGAELTVPSVG